MGALNDGRSAAFIGHLGKVFHAAVPQPHLTTKMQQGSGYDGPVSFQVAMVDVETGLPNGRFATVTITVRRDADLAEKIRRELGVQPT